MKKLLVVFNGTNYSTDLAIFALKIARVDHSVLHGVFLSPSLVPVAQYPFPNDLSLAASGAVTTGEMLEEQRQLLDANIQVFRDDCQQENIFCTVDRDPEITLEELIDHSAFTDIILCAAKEQMGGVSVRDLLVDTHCPVLLVPPNADLPTRVVLCYDESFSCILAMKMYSYLFPEWRAIPTTLLSINPKGDGEMRYHNYLSDWLPQHFSRMQQQILHGNLHRELVRFIRKGEDSTLVIMGAYGRNAVSRLFHRSLANVVIEETNACLFIMHE